MQTQKVLGGDEGKTRRKPDGPVLDGLHFHFPLSSQSNTANKKQQLPMGDSTVMFFFLFLFLRKNVSDAQVLSGYVFFGFLFKYSHGLSQCFMSHFNKEQIP